MIAFVLERDGFFEQRRIHRVGPSSISTKTGFAPQ